MQRVARIPKKAVSEKTHPRFRPREAMDPSSGAPHALVRRAENQVTDQTPPLQSVAGGTRTAFTHRLVHAVYLAAIAVATLGWLWCIVWLALQLF